MTTLDRRLGRLEDRQQQVTVEHLAAIIGPQLGIDPAVLADETHAVLAQCEAFGLTTAEAMLDFYAEELGVEIDILRAELAALQEMLR